MNWLESFYIVGRICEMSSAFISRKNQTDYIRKLGRQDNSLEKNYIYRKIDIIKY